MTAPTCAQVQARVDRLAKETGWARAEVIEWWKACRARYGGNDVVFARPVKIDHCL